MEQLSVYFMYLFFFLENEATYIRVNFNQLPYSCFQAVANSFEGHMAQLSDVQERGSRLRERCNSEGRLTIESKLRNLQRRWSDVKGKIFNKAQAVEGEIDEWSKFTKELDQRLTELRNADISLGVAIISTTELKALEDQLATVKVCYAFIPGVHEM